MGRFRLLFCEVCPEKENSGFQIAPSPPSVFLCQALPPCFCFLSLFLSGHWQCLVVRCCALGKGVGTDSKLMVKGDRMASPGLPPKLHERKTKPSMEDNVCVERERVREKERESKREGHYGNVKGGGGLLRSVCMEESENACKTKGIMGKLRKCKEVQSADVLK